IGSLVSQRFSVERNWKGGVVLLAAAFGIIYSISLKHIVGATLGWEFSERLMLSIALLAPMGFFMGMPFPMGIRYLAAAKGSRLIPWAWGVNGAFSVVGSILAALLALGAGFSGVMFAAAILYASAFFSIYLSAPRQS
ncbi:MAG: SAM-dependent methyltransferase, partial [Nanoarchaeota archaeon]